MATQKIYEVRNDYTDYDNYTHIDVWESDDENAEGRTAAIVCLDTGKVFFIDNGLRWHPEIKEAIAEVQKRRLKIDTDLNPHLDKSNDRNIFRCMEGGTDGG